MIHEEQRKKGRWVVRVACTLEDSGGSSTHFNTHIAPYCRTYSPTPNLPLVDAQDSCTKHCRRSGWA